MTPMRKGLDFEPPQPLATSAVAATRSARLARIPDHPDSGRRNRKGLRAHAEGESLDDAAGRGVDARHVMADASGNPDAARADGHVGRTSTDAHAPDELPRPCVDL